MIYVDKEVCIGCGACAGICPEVFEISDDGKAEAKSQESAECAQEATEACPVQAIKLQ